MLLIRTKNISYAPAKIISQGLIKIALLLCSVHSLACTQVVDQALTFQSAQWSAAVSSGISRGQSFTVDVGGTLTAVELPLSRQTSSVAGSFTLEIYLVENNGVVGAMLYSRSYDAESISAVGAFQNSWMLFDLQAANIQLAQGDKLMIGLQFSNPDWIFWDSVYIDQYPGGYPGGSAYYSTNSGSQWPENTSHGHGFRTYMIAAPLEGDVNGDGLVDAKDLLRLQRILLSQ